MEFKIKKLSAEEFDIAYKLIWPVFMEYEAPVYPERGVESFREFLYGGSIEKRYEEGLYTMLLCLADGIPAAAGGMRDGNHVSLLFTKTEYQRHGIGRMFISEFEKIASEQGYKTLSVNASPYGIPFYKAVGFREAGMESCADGIVYTPMIKMIKRSDIHGKNNT